MLKCQFIVKTLLDFMVRCNSNCGKAGWVIGLQVKYQILIKTLWVFSNCVYLEEISMISVESLGLNFMQHKTESWIGSISLLTDIWSITASVMRYLSYVMTWYASGYSVLFCLLQILEITVQQWSIVFYFQRQWQHVQKIPRHVACQ